MARRRRSRKNPLVPISEIEKYSRRFPAPQPPPPPPPPPPETTTQARKNPRRARKARRMHPLMKMVRNPGYGMVQLADAKVAGVPVLPVAGFGLLAYGLYDADDMMARLQRPIVIGGAVAGGLAGYKYGKGLLEQASFLALGAGLGLLVDRFIGE